MGAINKISEKIKKFRKKINYTQKKVADYLGVDRSTYSYYELGKIIPDVKTIMSLSKIFGVNYTEILESEGAAQFSDFSKNTQNTKSNNFENITNEEKDLLLAFRMLSKNSKKETMNFINEKYKKEK